MEADGGRASRPSHPCIKRALRRGRPLSNKSHQADLEIPPGIFDRHHKHISREEQAYSPQCVPDYSKCAHRVSLPADFASTKMPPLRKRKRSGNKGRQDSYTISDRPGYWPGTDLGGRNGKTFPTFEPTESPKIATAAAGPSEQCGSLCPRSNTSGSDGRGQFEWTRSET